MRPTRRLRRAGVLVAAAALLLSVFGPASFADLSTASPAPPYLSGLGTDFYASANKSWSGAKELTPDVSNNPLSKPTGQWDPDTLIWTKTCGKGAQTATFKRELKLPGKPTTSNFYIGAVWASGAANPFQSFTLSINGVKAVKGSLAGSGYTSVALPAKALKAFDNGQNTVAVAVKRGAIASKKCNTSDADRYGVQFRFSGEFAADLALADGPVQNFVYRHAATTSTTVSNISLRNLGPSGLVAGGTFWLKVSGVTAVSMLGDSTTPIPGTYPSAPPFDDCKATNTSPAPNLTVEITCELGAMPDGMTGYLSIGTVQEFASTAFHESSTLLQWKVGHPGDSTYDNQRSIQVVWCGSLSTKPECLALG